MPRFPLLGLLAGALLLPSGPASAAAKVIPGSYEKAQATVAEARAEEAEHYAPVELRMAEETLALAAAGLDRSRKDINIARAIELAQVQAELARAKSLGARLRDQVALREREIDELERELLGSESLQ